MNQSNLHIPAPCPSYHQMPHQCHHVEVVPPGGGEGDGGGGSELGSGQRPAAAATVGVHGQGLPSTASTAGGGGVENGGIVWERRAWGLGYRSGLVAMAAAPAWQGWGAGQRRRGGWRRWMRDAVGIGVPVRAGREGFERMFVRT
jgi:hypothetical protein